jgi:hypothetical protein
MSRRSLGGSRLPLLVTLGAGLVAAVAACSGSGGSGSNDAELARLDWKSWRAPTGTHIGPGGLSPRERISDQLQNCDCLEGTSRETVIRLMGSPETSHKVGGSQRSPQIPVAGLPESDQRAVRGAEKEVERIQGKVEKGSSEVLRYTLGPCVKDGRCFFPGSETEYLEIYIDLEGRVKKFDHFGT